MRGSSNSFSLSIAGLGGSKFAKGVADSRWYFPFKWGTAFSVHGSAGIVEAYGGDEVPVFQRFFLGGLDSLRGMKDHEVAPLGQKGWLPGVTETYNPGTTPATAVQVPVYLDGLSTIGGDKMAFCQFEYLFPLIPQAKIRGVVFCDVGDAWGGSWAVTGKEFSLCEDVGFGIRWNSPFGPLRVDFGINLNPKNDQSSSNFGFSAGAGF
jgi:outer membrane protein insertion porin family